MTVNTRKAAEHVAAEPLDILALYRTMVTARVMNDMLKTRKTQGRFPFYIGCAGHEAMAAVVAALQADDWLSLYYRDLAAWLQRTGDIHGPLREAYSRTTGPMGAGRNMPSHYSSQEHRILPAYSEVAALAPFAGGAAFSLQWHKSQQIIAFTTGDGGAATNDFNALFRQASVHKLPILMIVEDNGWAITTAATRQWGGSLVEWARGAGIHAEEVDGSNPMTAYEATLHLAEHVRSGKGPALMHLRMGLLDPHSSSTDMRKYRTREDIEA
ncbi:MAG: thiamine pyrophosphate-dependent dehydrogenase E1 component subunit alpha, partial [Ktedonobacteraceae bacterium]